MIRVIGGMVNRWSQDRVKFPALLDPPVGDVTDWLFSFDPPGDGVTVLPYWMTVTAFDAAGNPSIRDTRYFSIGSGDSVAPVLTVEVRWTRSRWRRRWCCRVRRLMRLV